VLLLVVAMFSFVNVRAGCTNVEVNSSVYKPRLFFNLELKTSRVAPSPI